MINESGVSFYPGGGHSHDGQNSSLITTSIYSVFDFPIQIVGDPSRTADQIRNLDSFKQLIIDTVNQSIIHPAGVVFQQGVINGSAHIISRSIYSDSIAALAITANEIAAGAIITDKILAGAITATQIAAGAITTDKILAGAITATQIAAGAITTDKILAGAITATEIDAGSITADKIVAGAITATEIDAAYVYAGSISADQIDAGTLTGREINNGSGTFQVTTGGALTATSATITGNITATSGSIGGFILSSGVLVGSSASTVINPNGDIDMAGTIYASGDLNCGGDVNASGSVEAATFFETGGYISASGNIDSGGIITASSIVQGAYFVGSGTVADTGVDVVRRSDGYYLKKTSVRSVKENIESFTNALDIVNALKPRTFNWKQNDGLLPDPDNIHTQQIKYAHKSHGFIVDEVQDVSEELVHWEIKEDGVSLEPVMWKTDDLIAVSVQAIKDLIGQIATLETRIAELEG